MRGPPVVLTDTLGRPVTNVISERGAVPMTVVNTLGEPVTLVNSGGEPVTLFNENGTLWDYPFSLFSNNEQGAWYDPSDFSTLYQNAAGTTPVTAVEQPVRLMLDRSRGLVLGSELVTNGTFDTDSDWTKGTGWTISGGIASNAGANASLGQGLSGLTVGRYYAITFTLVTSATNAIKHNAGGVFNAYNTYYSTAGTYTEICVANASSGNLTFWGGSGVQIDNVSVRELPGNHATAPNDASRPVLRARYNLLTYTEQFDNAAWNKTDATITANDITAPNDTTTADRITATGANAFVQFVFSSIAGTTYTTSVFLKAGNISSADLRGVNQGVVAYLARFTLTGAGTATAIAGSPTVSILALGDGWYRCSMTKTHTAAAVNDLIQIVPGNQGATVVSDYVYAWGASLLTAADQAATGGAYQRVAAATDYDTSNPVWRPYLAFDGSDDSMSTSSIDFSGTDEVTVFAGVTKLSDAATGAVLELTASGTNGSIGLFAPLGAAANYEWRSRGTALAQATTSNTFAAPITNVLTGIGDISSDVATLRVNGVQAATSATDQGTDNYANAALFIGRRNNSSLPFNGRLYGLTVLGRTATAAELSAMEAWVAGKTGVSLP